MDTKWIISLKKKKTPYVGVVMVPLVVLVVVVVSSDTSMGGSVEHPQMSTLSFLKNPPDNSSRIKQVTDASVM